MTLQQSNFPHVVPMVGWKQEPLSLCSFIFISKSTSMEEVTEGYAKTNAAFVLRMESL